MKTFRIWLGAAVCLCLAIAGRAAGLDLVDTAKLVATGSMEDDEFGASVALDRDVAVIGRINDPDDLGPGAAFVYRWNGLDWIEEQELAAGDGVGLNAFGVVVDVCGDVAVVGAFLADSSRGAVYVFRYDGSQWLEEQKVTADDGMPDDHFGIDVEVDGDLLLIGAPGLTGANNSAYVFRYDGSTWEEEEKLTPLSGGDDAGRAVGLSGNVAILGNQVANEFTGRAIVFRFDGSDWVEEQELTASDGEAWDFFGEEVSVEGDVAVVGAPSDQPGGAAYVFRFDGSEWMEEQRLIPDGDGGGFGARTSVKGDEAVIGSASNGQIGSAHVFAFDGASWAEVQKLEAGDGEARDEFGSSVALSGGRVLVSARGDDGDRGAAYVFSLPTCLAGIVNAANERVTNALFVDGLSGGSDRTVELGEGEAMTVTMLQPVAGGTGRFVLHVNEGAPSVATETDLPFVVGRTCFPFLLSDGATPVIVANNLGRSGLVGASHFFGTPSPDPDRATTTLHYPDFPVGTTLTFQGLILDPGALSSKSASVTNAVVVQVVP